MAISNPTPKQVRNGADTGAPGSGANMAKPGPDFTAQVASAKRQAQAAGDRRKRETAALIQSPQGSGVTGHEVGTGGSTWDWKAGLAIREADGS